MSQWPLPLGVSTTVFARGDGDEAIHALAASSFTGPFNYEVRPPAEAPTEALRIIEVNYAKLCRSAAGATGA